MIPLKLLTDTCISKFTDKFEFIDEVETNPHKNVTLELSSSLREEGKRKRIPPARTKSMPMSAFYVVYGGKKLM